MFVKKWLGMVTSSAIGVYFYIFASGIDGLNIKGEKSNLNVEKNRGRVLMNVVSRRLHIRGLVSSREMHHIQQISWGNRRIDDSEMKQLLSNLFYSVILFFFHLFGAFEGQVLESTQSNAT